MEVRHPLRCFFRWLLAAAMLTRCTDPQVSVVEAPLQDVFAEAPQAPEVVVTPDGVEAIEAAADPGQAIEGRDFLSDPQMPGDDGPVDTDPGPEDVADATDLPVGPDPFDETVKKCSLAFIPPPGKPLPAPIATATPLPPDGTPALGQQASARLDIFTCCRDFANFFRSPVDGGYRITRWTTGWPLDGPCNTYANSEHALVPLRFDCSATGAKLENVVEMRLFDPETNTRVDHAYLVTTEWTLPARCTGPADWDATCCPPLP